MRSGLAAARERPSGVLAPAKIACICSGPPAATHDVASGGEEKIAVRNYSLERSECVIVLTFEADFADVFEVKEARVQRRWDEARQIDGDPVAG